MAAQALDETRVEQFMGQVLGYCNDGMVALMIDLGDRVGLFDAAAEGTATSELAARTGLQERYVREWLACLTAARIVEYDPDAATYTLPPEHAACLTSTGPASVASAAQVNTHLAKHVPAVAEVFRHGGGVPYSAYMPEFTSFMDAASRVAYDNFLVDAWLPLAPGLTEQLTKGARVADVGCGTGHALVVLATAFPQSTFVGYDLNADGIDAARKEADAEGLTNVTFEVADAASLTTDTSFDVVLSIDSIHDQVDPARVLQRIHDALAPGGTYLMVEPATSSLLEENVANLVAPWIYGISTLHCMTVSLAGGGAGLGTAWGSQLATSMLTDAGFTLSASHPTPGDPTNAIFVSTRA